MITKENVKKDKIKSDRTNSSHTDSVEYALNAGEKTGFGIIAPKYKVT